MRVDLPEPHGPTTPTRGVLRPGSSIVVHQGIELLRPSQDGEHVTSVQHDSITRVHFGLVIMANEYHAQVVVILDEAYGLAYELCVRPYHEAGQTELLTLHGNWVSHVGTGRGRREDRRCHAGAAQRGKAELLLQRLRKVLVKYADDHPDFRVQLACFEGDLQIQ